MEANASATVVPLQAPSGEVSRGGYASDLQAPEGLPFAVGSRIADRFQVKRLLGVGGTSCVYQAWDEYLASDGTADAYVAIKAPRRLNDNECGTDLIFREVKVARRVMSRRGLIDVFELHQDHGRFFLTQELARGESLRSRLDRAGGRGLPYKSCMALTRELVLTVSEMHAAGIVHADIKPSNVLLTEAGQLRLIDLATARPINAMSGIAEPPFHGFSPAYASPQTLNDEPADPRDDVYSLACMLYELLSGQHPYDGATPLEAKAAGVSPKRPPDLGHAQWRVLRQGLAFDAQRRPNDIRRFWRRFVRARRHAGLLAIGLGFTALVSLLLLFAVGGAQAHEVVADLESADLVREEAHLGE